MAVTILQKAIKATNEVPIMDDVGMLIKNNERVNLTKHIHLI